MYGMTKPEYKKQMVGTAELYTFSYQIKFIHSLILFVCNVLKVVQKVIQL